MRSASASKPCGRGDATVDALAEEVDTPPTEPAARRRRSVEVSGKRHQYQQVKPPVCSTGLGTTARTILLAKLEMSNSVVR